MEELSEKTWQTISASQALFMENHTEISSRMYQIMFERHPEVKKMFDKAPFNQPRMFEAAILAYLVSKDDPSVLNSYRNGICSRHVDVGVKEEHYDIMADALFQAMSDVLEDKATPEILQAWQKWFYFIANLLIDRERQHYSGEKRLFPEGAHASSSSHFFNH